MLQPLCLYWHPGITLQCKGIEINLVVGVGSLAIQCCRCQHIFNMTSWGFMVKIVFGWQAANRKPASAASVRPHSAAAAPLGAAPASTAKGNSAVLLCDSRGRAHVGAAGGPWPGF